MMQLENRRAVREREGEGKGGEEEQAKGRRDEEIVTHAHPKQFTVAFTFTRRQNVAPFPHSSVAQGEGTVATTDRERETGRKTVRQTDRELARKRSKICSSHFISTLSTLVAPPN